jgi:hypothetical protein
MIFQGLHVAGKKDYHDKFHPDEAQSSRLYLVFPPGIPSLRHMQGIVHVANIKMREVLFKSAMMGKGEDKEGKKLGEVVREKEGKKSGESTSSSEKLVTKTREMSSAERLISKSREKLHISAIVVPRRSNES